MKNNIPKDLLKVVFDTAKEISAGGETIHQTFGELSISLERLFTKTVKKSEGSDGSKVVEEKVWLTDKSEQKEFVKEYHKSAISLLNQVYENQRHTKQLILNISLLLYFQYIFPHDILKCMNNTTSVSNTKKKVDFRKYTKAAQEQVRLESVKRVIKGKESPEKVAAEYGYDRSCIYEWLRTYRKKGYEGLLARKGTGRPRGLTNVQIAMLKKLLNKDPRQLKFHFGLWTIEMVRQLVRERFGKEYAISGIHNLLHSLGYSYQTPILKPVEQNPKAVQTFMQEEYPNIKKEAQIEGRDIYFSDESGFQSIHNKVKTWSKQGQRPVITHTGRRFSKGVISAITPTGKIRFMQYDGGMNQDLFILFLKRLQASSEKPITLIVDGLPVHKSKRVREYIQNTQGAIKMYLLPGYSPDLNPDELVWSAAKRHVQRKLIRTKSQLEKEIASFMHRIQKTPGYISSLFKHPSVAYISES